jgi:uncharacterized protein
MIGQAIPLVLAIATAQSTNPTYPARPIGRGSICDEAGILSESDEAEIRSISDRLFTDTRVPIVVVTIQSLESHGARGRPIERYAKGLFDRWGIGLRDWNYGVLMLVSLGDRKVRIELGASWGRSLDSKAAEIMEKTILPQMKCGGHARGVVLGVRDLDRVARESLGGRHPVLTWLLALLIGFLTVAGGLWFWKGLAGSGGGGSGHTPYGGGTSGGGGATGNW